MTLTSKKQKAIAALLTTPSRGEAARLVGITERTLYRWLQEDTFRLELAQKEGLVIDDAARKLLSLQGQAIETLSDILVNSTDKYRLQAAQTILAYHLRLRELRNTEERLTRLEANLLSEDTE